VLLISACSTGYAPVADISTSAAKSSRVGNKGAARNLNKNKRSIAQLPKTYKVKSGDTLYSIAWRYGLDFRLLAKKNKIANDYLIYKGQILKIKSIAQSKAATKKKYKVNNSKTKTQKSNTKKDIEDQTNRKNPEKQAKKQYKNPPNKAKTAEDNKKFNNHSNVRWVWPVKGLKYKKFTIENKGLDFSGSTGDRVLAAASGKVVYAGNGIIGYGNLIIIKHSQEYLSAYAHNSVILVKENEQIKAGEKIAEIGSSGTIKTILHFEIRKGGKPVNPIRYLPK
jgi:lipoprotein NlpD